MTTDPINTVLTNPPVSVEASPDGVLVLTFWTDMATSSAVRVHFSPFEIVDVVREITQQAFYAMRDALDDAVDGPCERCASHRLVSVPRPGGDVEESVHCPECTPRQAERRARYAASVADLTRTRQALL